MEEHELVMQMELIHAQAHPQKSGQAMMVSQLKTMLALFTISQNLLILL